MTCFHATAADKCDVCLRVEELEAALYKIVKDEYEAPGGRLIRPMMFTNSELAIVTELWERNKGEQVPGAGDFEGRDE